MLEPRLIFPEKRTAIVGCVTTTFGLEMLAAPSPDADVIEVRLDALLAKGASVEEVTSALKQRKLPVILTLRRQDEGGQHKWKPGERKSLLETMLEMVEGVDIEIASLEELRSVAHAAAEGKKEVILSAHSLSIQVSPEQLEQWDWIYEGFRTSVPRAQEKCILKVATLVKGPADYRNLAKLLVLRERPVAVMGTGPLSGESRMIFAKLGSRLVYGYLDEPAAPGQPSVTDLQKMLA